jgi:iron complex outermembrane recepter protein
MTARDEMTKGVKMVNNKKSSMVWADGLMGRILVGAATSIIALTQALAQSESTLQPRTISGGELEEIVVTAQKRSENINTVPLSITAVSGEQLKETGVTQTADLEKVVPGFTYQPSAYGVPVFTIRGVGFYDVSLAAAPAVSVYVDQVPLPYSYMAEGALLDLERVEALKGPQGTLFGENSTGGAINYIAAKPTKQLAAGGEVSYGRFNSVDVDQFVSGPLADTLTVRFAIRTEQRGDWQKSQTSSNTNGERDFTTARLLLDWTPTDRVNWELNVNGWLDKSDTQASQFVEYAPLNAAGRQTLVPLLKAFSPAPNDPNVADWDPAFSLKRNDSFEQVSLRGDVQLNEKISLASITSYSHLKVYSPIDTDGTPYDDYTQTIRGSIETVTQELRLSGQSLSDNLKWMVGGNYEHDTTVDHQTSVAKSTSLEVGPYVFSGDTNVNDQKIETEAVFGSLDYNITSQFAVQGSVRYTKDSDNFSGCVQDPGNGELATAFSFLSTLLSGKPQTIAPGACATLGNNFAPLPIVQQSLSQHNISWRAGVSWTPETDTLLYANATRGYKAGGFSTIPGINVDQFKPDTQESVLVYETGFKVTLPDRTLHFDGAVFYYTYDDKQIAGYLQYGPPFGNLPALVSVPRSSAKGAELSTTWRPVAPLTIRAGATYVDTRVDTSFITDDPFGNVIDIKGESFPNTPRWQFVSDAQYNFDLTGNLTGFVGASFRYRTSTSAAFGNSPLFVLPAYGVLDLRAGVETDGGRWRFELWGRNVADRFYVTEIDHQTDTVARVTGMPATFGVTIGYRL